MKPAAPSKGQLRAQIAKLEADNAKLKARNRDARRAAKATDGQVAELKAEVARLREQVAAAAAPPTPDRTPTSPCIGSPRTGRPGRRKGIDPGDAVPPGEAVEQPDPTDAEAEAAPDVLETHIPSR